MSCFPVPSPSGNNNFSLGIRPFPWISPWNPGGAPSQSTGILYCPGNEDWFRDRHMTQQNQGCPLRAFLGLHQRQLDSFFLTWDLRECKLRSCGIHLARPQSLGARSTQSPKGNLSGDLESAAPWSQDLHFCVARTDAFSPSRQLAWTGFSDTWGWSLIYRMA